MELGQGFPKLDLTEFDSLSPRAPLENADFGIVRLCLATNDLITDYEQLIRQGVKFLSSPQAGVNGMADIAVCVDPDGSLIELIQIYPEKWRALN